MKSFISIGTKVAIKVYREMGKEYEDKDTKTTIYKKLFRKEFDKTKVGIITGGKYVFEGKYIEPRYHGSYYGDDYSQAYLESPKGIFVYLVRFGFTNKEIMILPIDADTYTWHYVPTAKFKFPFRNVESFWDQKAKDEMRDIMKNFPRDKKGRWVK